MYFACRRDEAWLASTEYKEETKEGEAIAVEQTVSADSGETSASFTDSQDTDVRRGSAFC